MRRQSPSVVVIEGEVVRSPSYGTFSATPLNAGERVYLQTKMEATVAAIRGAFKVAHGKVAVTPNALMGATMAILTAGLSTLGIHSAPEATKTAVDNALTSLQGAFEQNVVGAMPRVYSGDLDPERWFNMTKGYIDSIRSILDELGSSGTGASLMAVFDGMFGDTKEFLRRFKQGVEATFDFMPFIIGGAALLGTYLVVTRFLPQRRALSGYRSKRRKLRLT